MKKIVLAAAMLASASGMALAGSENYGSGYIPGSSNYPNTGHHAMISDAAAPIDLGSTNSIGTTRNGSAAGGNSAFDIPAAGYGQGIWGH